MITPEELQTNEIAAILQEYTQLRNLGVGEGLRDIHISQPHRYAAIADQLSNPQSILHHKLVEDADRVTIRECTTGSGEAIVTMVDYLSRQGIPWNLELSGMLNPLTTLSDKVYLQIEAELGNRIQIQEKSADLLSEDYSQPSEVDLAIIGFLHPYVNQKGMAKAIQNALKFARFIAIAPCEEYTVVSEIRGMVDALFIQKLEYGFDTFQHRVDVKFYNSFLP